MMSRTNLPPIGIARLNRYMAGKTDKICVFVGKVTDDVRLTGFDLPALKVCALAVSDGARARILKAGGEVYTFDQLATMAPKGQNTVLLRGRRTARKANKYFGTPVDGTTRPFTRAKGRKFEAARGRRKSRGFKI